MRASSPSASTGVRRVAPTTDRNAGTGWPVARIQWIVHPIFYYCGLNQFIMQRTLAARSLAQGQ
jgi:uncharacterized sodium:solute symporter family permease YidK